MDMVETPGASQAVPCNTQPSPVESSQLVSGQSSEMPTWKQTVMASACCNPHETDCTQNSTAHPGKATDFYFGEPSETASFIQQVVSAEQKSSPAGSCLMNLSSTTKSCLSHPLKTEVLDTRKTLCNEGHWRRTLNSDKTLLIQITTMYDSQWRTLDNHPVALSGSHEGQAPNMDHLVDSVSNQTFIGDLEMEPSCNHVLYTDQFITSFSEQYPFGDQQRSPVADNRFYADQRILPNGYQTFYEPQMSTNHQITCFCGQNVCRCQEILLSGEHLLSEYQTSGYRYDQDLIVNHQVTSPIGGEPLHDSQIPNSNFDTTSCGTKRTTSSEEDNLAWHPETSLSSEETFLDQMRTSVDQNVYPSHNGTLKIEESLEPQVTSLSNQSPYVGESSDTSNSPLIQIQPQEISSASGLDQGQHPEIKLDLKTQSPVSLKNPHNSKPYCCTYQGCKKSYKKSQHLKDHMRKHTGVKPYMCNKPGCDWKFFRLVDLNRHKQKHSGERPYPCPMCNRNYSRFYYLKQHLRSHIQASPTTAT
ncbi:Kruppel-like factor 18 [Rattus rattus]|uniref:Kruppel-like factor 18 n=1 Tax=Rattus rattus TaxID=10117 RepID=UPI0013F39128|nr:Kruppel-like factor 18 [Rattus rattus]